MRLREGKKWSLDMDIYLFGSWLPSISPIVISLELIGPNGSGGLFDVRSRTEARTLIDPRPVHYPSYSALVVPRTKYVPEPEIIHCRVPQERRVNVPEIRRLL